MIKAATLTTAHTFVVKHISTDRFGSSVSHMLRINAANSIVIGNLHEVCHLADNFRCHSDQVWCDLPVMNFLKDSSWFTDFEEF